MDLIYEIQSSYIWEIIDRKSDLNRDGLRFSHSQKEVLLSILISLGITGCVLILTRWKPEGNSVLQGSLLVHAYFCLYILAQ